MSGAARVLRHACQLKAVRGPWTVPQSQTQRVLKTALRLPPVHCKASAARAWRKGQLEGRAGPRLPALLLWGWAGPAGGFREADARVHVFPPRSRRRRAGPADGRCDQGFRDVGLSRPPPPPVQPRVYVSVMSLGRGVPPGPPACLGRRFSGPQTWPQDRFGPSQVSAGLGGLCSGTGVMPPGPVSPWPSGREPGGT